MLLAFDGRVNIPAALWATCSLAGLLLSVPAQACEPEPFLFQLPGETVDAAEERSTTILADNKVFRRVDRENDAFKKARNIYLARIVATTEDPRTRDRITEVRPVGAIRGSAPSANQRLRDHGTRGLCATVGDGDISYLPRGTYVVVFDGLPHDTYRPRGIDSFAVDSVRNADLLGALMKFGKYPEED